MSKLTLTREQLSILMDIVGDGGEVVLNPTSLTVYRLDGLGAVGFTLAKELVDELRKQQIDAFFLMKPLSATFEFGTLSLNVTPHPTKAQLKQGAKAPQIPELESLAALLPLAFEPSSKSTLVLPKHAHLSKSNRKTLKSAFGMTVAIEED